MADRPFGHRRAGVQWGVEVGLTPQDTALPPAMALARKRVVVKRPDYAEDLAGVKPSMVIETKKNRFDVYIKSAMK